MRRILAILCALFALAFTAGAKEPLRRCMDSGVSNFIESAEVPTNQLSQKFPGTEYERGGANYDDPKARGKLVWRELPAGAKVDVDIIGNFQGHEIYRALYEWKEEEIAHQRLLMGYCDEAVSVVRPFFVADGGEEISQFEVVFVSTKTRPFGLNVRLNWRGNGAMASTFAYTFEGAGPRLMSRTDSGRGNEGKVRKY